MPTRRADTGGCWEGHPVALQTCDELVACRFFQIAVISYFCFQFTLVGILAKCAVLV